MFQSLRSFFSRLSCLFFIICLGLFASCVKLKSSVLLEIADTNGAGITVTVTSSDGVSGSYTLSSDASELNTNVRNLVISREETLGYTASLSNVPSGTRCMLTSASGLTDRESIVMTLYCETSIPSPGPSVTVTGLDDDESITVGLGSEYAASDDSSFSLTLTGDSTDTFANDFMLNAPYTISITSDLLNMGKVCTFQDVSNEYAISGVNTSSNPIDDITIACTKAHFLYNTTGTRVSGKYVRYASGSFRCENEPAAVNVLDCDIAIEPFISMGTYFQISGIPNLYSDFDTTLPVYSYIPAQPGVPAVLVKIATSWNDLLDGEILNDSQLESFWSGSDVNGNFSELQACRFWNSSDSALLANVGNGGTDSTWLASSFSCDTYHDYACLCINSGTSTTTTGTTYSVGGTVSGLLSGSVTLSLNSGSQTKAVSSNGSFSFDTEVAEGTEYTITVATQPGVSTCTVSSGTGTLSADVTNITVTCVDSVNFLFLTTSTTKGNFGGRAAADTLCETAQDNNFSSLSCDGGVRAFLSTGAADEISDFPTTYSVDTSLAVYNADGFAKVADNWTDLLDGSVDSSFDQEWWSGSNSNGTTAFPEDCGTWSSTGLTGNYGGASETGTNWMATIMGDCNVARRLMCLCIQ